MYHRQREMTMVRKFFFLPIPGMMANINYFRKQIKPLLIVVYCIFFIVSKSLEVPLGDGKKIFTARCKTCHGINKDFAGPALANIDKRYNMNWIIRFVQSPGKVIASGDSSATALFIQYNRTIMPDYPNLTTDNIKSIVEYIQEESGKSISAADEPFDQRKLLQPEADKPDKRSNNVIISFAIVVITLVLVLLFAIYVKKLQRKMHGQ